jgi:RNA polymerase-binding transcription factor DksA
MDMSDPDKDDRTESQKRVDALIEEQRRIAEINREKARLEQETFGWGDKG